MTVKPEITKRKIARREKIFSFSIETEEPRMKTATQNDVLVQ